MKYFSALFFLYKFLRNHGILIHTGKTLVRLDMCRLVQVFTVCINTNDLVIRNSRKCKESSLFSFNPVAHRKAKIVYHFGLSECNRVKTSQDTIYISLFMTDPYAQYQSKTQTGIECIKNFSSYYTSWH